MFSTKRNLCTVRRMLCSVRRSVQYKKGTFSAVRQLVWLEKKVCSIRNVTSEIRREKVCTTWRVASAV